MSDIDPTDLFSEFDDGEPGTPPDGTTDSVADHLARLDAAVLLESLSTSDLVPDFGNADDSHPDSPLFEEPPIKEGDTDVPRPALGDSGITPLPVPSRDKQVDPRPDPVALPDAGPSAPSRKDDLTPDFAGILAPDEPPFNSDESSPEEEAPYRVAVTPTLPMLPPDVGREDFVRSELSTEPAPPDVDEMDLTDTPPTGPAAQGDVVVRVFFPRPPGEEPTKGRSSSSPLPFAAKATPPAQSEADLVFDAEPEGYATDDSAATDHRSVVEMPAEETDPSKIETRPHPRPAGGDVVDILAARPVSAEPEHVPVIQEFSWSDIQEPIVQESFARDDELAVEPVELPAVPARKPRRRGVLVWLVVGTIAAVLLIAAGLGLWGVLGLSISSSLAGFFGPRVTPTPPFGVLLEPTAVTEAEPETRPTPTPFPQPSPTFEPPAILTEEGIVQQDIPMVFVPGGSFEMGSGIQVYRVTLSPYYIDTFEVTNQAYSRCVDASACTGPQSLENYAGDTYYGAPAFLEHPVVNVTWEQASAYCQWRGARLPTEAEWEMAARVDPETGVETVYPWGSQWDPTRLNYCDASCVLAANADPAYNDTWPQTARVGSFASGASGVGAMDLAGNVSEWVSDWFAADYYLISPEQDPSGPDSGQDRVIRGGAWGVSNPDLFLSTARTHFDPTTSGPGTGFRCAASAADIEGLPTDESEEDT